LLAVTASPLVTAVIPAYNARLFVADAVHSVLEQTYAPLECIVVDDGSTDGTDEAVAKLGERVRAIRKLNGGVSSARNAGARAGSGEYLAFLDADDLWLPEKIDHQMRLATQRSGVGLFYTGVSVVDEALRPLGELRPASPDVALRNMLLLRQPSIPAIASTALIPTAIFRSLSGFDERLSTSADYDLACRIALRYPVERLDEALALYRIHGAQMHRDPRALEHDMRIVHEKIFATQALPPEIRALRREAAANLSVMLAAFYFQRRDPMRLLKHLIAGVGQQPAATIRCVVARARVKLERATGRRRGWLADA
jgi:glycosyltransferase involved in cell wall biosynthesis